MTAVPKIKCTDRQKRIAAIEGVIRQYSVLYGYETHQSVADFLGMTREWYYQKRKNPEKWTIGELDTLIRVLHIPTAELLTALYSDGT